MTEQQTKQAQPSDPYRQQKMVLVAVLVMVLVALSALLYFSPWVTKEIDIGHSQEARRNPFLAAETFLARFDTPVKTQNGLALLDELPPTDDTLLIASSRRSLSERRTKNLIDWVHQGGALILLASDLYDEEREDKGDRLLNSFGIGLYEGEPDVEGAEKPDAAAQIDLTDESTGDGDTKKSLADILSSLQQTRNNCHMGEGFTEITIDGEQRDLIAELPTTRHLYFEDDLDYAYAANATGAQLVYVEHGKGSIYALTSLDQWRNREIGCNDHAHLLRSLTDNSNTLWLMFNTDIEPIYQIIWHKWPVAVAMAFSWLALWLWRSAYRTTRIEPEESNERREVIEHITGMSRFLYQQKKVGLLLSALRKDCLGDSAQDKKKLRRKIARWSKQSGIAQEQIRWALTANIPRDSREFINAVSVLQKIRHLPKAH